MTENAIAKRNSLDLLSPDDIIENLAGDNDELNPGDFLPKIRSAKMDKDYSDTRTGIVFGEDKAEIDLGSEWAVDITTYEKGWMYFDEKGGKGDGAMEQIMTSAFEKDMPPKPNDGKDWRAGARFEVVALTGEFAGTRAVVSSNSAWVNDMRVVLNEAISAQMRQVKDIRQCFPIVTWSHTTWEHKKYGTIVKPLIKVVGFTDQNFSGTADNVEVVGEVVSSEVDETETEQPTRRRRRS